jgi:hypothetical protein
MLHCIITDINDIKPDGVLVLELYYILLSLVGICIVLFIAYSVLLNVICIANQSYLYLVLHVICIVLFHVI